MRTQIYAEPELELLDNPENAAAWRSLCEELGLDNQLSLTSSTSAAGPPYMIADPRTQRIIRTLCPSVVKLTEYRQSTIPTEVLKEAAKCRKNGWYHELYVASDTKSPDPFLLGRLTKEFNSGWHVIARWGDEVLPWGELEHKAIQRIADEAKADLEKLIAKAQFKLQDINQTAKLLLAGENLPSRDYTVNTLPSLF